MASSYTITNVKLSKSPFDASDTVDIQYTIKNTGTTTITSYSAKIAYIVEDGGADPLAYQFVNIAFLNTGASLAKTKSRTMKQTVNLAETVAQADLDELFGEGARAVSVSLIVLVNFSGDLRISHAALGTMLNDCCYPRITADIIRADSSGNEDDEGQYAWMNASIRIYSENQAAIQSLWENFRVHYAANRAATLEDPYISLYDKRSQFIGLPYIVTHYTPQGSTTHVEYYEYVPIDQGRILISPSTLFSLGNDYNFLFYFGDQYEYATVASTIFNAFANVHLSGCGKGVAFGKFSASTEDNPLFECDYPAKFQNDVAVSGKAEFRGDISVPNMSLFRRVTVTDTMSFAAGGNKSDTGTVDIDVPDGYKPLAVAQFRVSGTGASFVHLYRLTLDVSANTLNWGAMSINSNATSPTLTVVVLCFRMTPENS